MAQNRLLLWRERLFYTTKALNDDASRMRAVVNNSILHLHPASVPAVSLRLTYTWGLGGISVFLALLLGITGLLLMFRYDASVERAYTSIQALETQVIFGSLIRGIHHWSANLLVVTTVLHLVRVFYTGSYKRGRTMNWLVGIALLLGVLAFNFTGYLLPWDQLAYWAITVSTSLFGYIPYIGKTLGSFFMGGPSVGQGTLRNFYAIHVAVLPALGLLVMSYHFWKIRKNGGISYPEQPEGRKRMERVTTIPNLTRIEFAAVSVVLVGILAWVIFTPTPLEGLADPAHSPNPAKAAWYFLGLQELLLHMDAFAAILLVVFVLLGMVTIPYVDRRGEDIGVYFRSKKGRWAAALGAFLAIDIVPLLVVADEYWLNLPALMPGLSMTISNGLVPLGIVLLLFALIYGFARWILKANHSEGLVGLFTFMVIGLVVLTIIGIYFRGPNMALVLPF